MLRKFAGKILKGDTVEIISGQYKGKRGLICKNRIKENWVTIKDLMTKKTNAFGERKEMPTRLDVSKVAVIDPSIDKPVRVKVTKEGGEFKRISCKTKTPIPFPPKEYLTYAKRIEKKSIIVTRARFIRHSGGCGNASDLQR